MSKYQKGLLAAFLLVWAWAAINPVYQHDWLLENYLVFIFVPVILLIARYFRLSNISYTLITIFMILHVIGSHYTYAEVPFGFTLQDWLGADRNMYDRLVHFSFGLLLAYPVREAFVRIAGSKGFWGFYLPLDLTLSLSALYEIIEWMTAATVDPSAGAAYLGTQGDEWDAQKDMLMAGLGALITMLITAAVHIRYNPRFITEIKKSFQLPKGDAPLGEFMLRKMVRKKALKKR